MPGSSAAATAASVSAATLPAARSFCRARSSCSSITEQLCAVAASATNTFRIYRQWVVFVRCTSLLHPWSLDDQRRPVTDRAAAANAAESAFYWVVRPFARGWLIGCKTRPEVPRHVALRLLVWLGLRS